MLRTRLLTAAIALPILLAAIFFSSASFFRFFIAILGCWALYEAAAMTHFANTARSTEPPAAPVGVSTPLEIAIVLVLGVVPMFVFLYAADPGWPLPTLVILGMLAVMIKVARGGAEAGPKGLLLTAIGAAYTGVLFPYFALLRNAPRGIPMLVLMLLLVIASDSGAYFVGRAIGRIKLMPRVSPNKTMEGAIGGLVASIVGGLILRPLLVPDWTIFATAIFSAVIAVLAQLGDLTGSALKRTCGVKDSGWLFPGHGGLIDRTCSLVFAAVFTYYHIS